MCPVMFKVFFYIVNLVQPVSAMSGMTKPMKRIRIFVKVTSFVRFDAEITENLPSSNFLLKHVQMILFTSCLCLTHNSTQTIMNVRVPFGS